MKRILGPTPAFFRHAACRGCPDAFFTDIWPPRKDGTSSTEADVEALERARDICRQCPVRTDCLEWAMREEAGAAAETRYGLAALLTPQQRWSLEKRGTLRSECHEEVQDPDGHLQGTLTCPTCLARVECRPLPNSGDLWNRRHTQLAQRVVAWLVESVRVGDQLPAPGRLADTWRVRRHDMVRVYQALVEDGTLTKDRTTEPPTYVRVGEVRAGTWVPPHLRNATHRAGVGTCDHGE